MQLREARSYLQALEDTVRILPREGVDEQVESVLRPNSTIGKAREAILAAGRPLHIQDILLAVGKPSTREARAALSGSLASYVRRREIFTRPAPNTFGVVELLDIRFVPTPQGNGGKVHEPPPGFGEDEEEEKSA